LWQSQNMHKLKLTSMHKLMEVGALDMTAGGAGKYP